MKLQITLGKHLDSSSAAHISLRQIAIRTSQRLVSEAQLQIEVDRATKCTKGLRLKATGGSMHASVHHLAMGKENDEEFGFQWVILRWLGWALEINMK